MPGVCDCLCGCPLLTAVYSGWSPRAAAQRAGAYRGWSMGRRAATYTQPPFARQVVGVPRVAKPVRPRQRRVSVIVSPTECFERRMTMNVAITGSRTEVFASALLQQTCRASSPWCMRVLVTVMLAAGVSRCHVCREARADDIETNDSQLSADVMSLKERAVELLRSGDYKTGRAYWHAAITLATSYDTYEPIAVHEITSEDIRFGQRQIQQLCRDRPILMAYRRLPEFKGVERSLVELFAGRLSGYRIRWGGDTSNPQAVAECSRVRDGSATKAAIHLVSSQRIGKTEGHWKQERLWSSVAFELFNASELVAHDHIPERVRNGKLSRDEFIESVVRFEVVAIRRTQRFYSETWLPFVISAGLQTDCRIWYSDRRWWVRKPHRFILNRTPRTEWYPWQVYAKMYDTLQQR